MPESHPAASDVDVWDTESVFVHVTAVPTATFSWSGMKAAVPSEAAPVGMATDDDVPPGVAVGAGVGAGADDGVGEVAVDDE
jgi:hypothetical protein